MSTQADNMPSPTLTELIPPKDDYLYFEHARDQPFQPLADDFSLVNARWLAEVSLLAYGSESFIRPRLEASENALPSTLDLRVFTDDDHGNQCVVISGDQFAIVAFRGTPATDSPTRSTCTGCLWSTPSTCGPTSTSRSRR